MTGQLLRSNVEFAKRVFLDRLGDPYVYGGCYDPFNLGVGADCSGSAGIFLGAALHGPTAMSWSRLFTTETFPGPLTGFRQTTQQDLLTGTYPLTVCIGHHGGGEDSHMHIHVDGVCMESNGSHGTCTDSSGAMSDSDPYWNDWWVWDGPIVEDTTERQPMGYPKGLDYAGGRITGADLAANGISFVCRYLSDGGPGLPGKQLLPDEFTDLQTNNIGVVFNWETTADFMRGGAPQGTQDAQTALAYIQSLPGMAGANPVIYFSADFDATPDDQVPINAYLQAAAQVLGGVQFVGIYGGYWPVSRALDAGVATFAWQTQAWSGGNLTSQVNIVQNNNAGYMTISGVECDVNEAHTTDFGQWPRPGTAPVSEGNTGVDDSLIGTGLTQGEHDALIAIRDALLTPVPSQSKYAPPGTMFAPIDLICFTDGRANEAMVEREALLGSPPHIALVKAAADAGDEAAQHVLSKCPTS